jgi:hypothetical protein
MGHPLSFLDLSGGQVHGRKYVPQVAVKHLIVTGGTGRGKIEPHIRFEVVQRQPQAAHVTHPHLHLAHPATPQGGSLEPTGRFHVVPAYSLTLSIQNAEKSFSLGVSLRGSLAGPPGGCRVVLGQSFPLMAHEPDKILRVCISLMGQWKQLGYRRSIIAVLKCVAAGVENGVGTSHKKIIARFRSFPPALRGRQAVIFAILRIWLTMETL